MITETDIANRAIQHCGGELIPAGSLWTDDSKNAMEIRACYDIVRRSELRRNVWRYSIRTEMLRPRETTTKLVTFPTWSALVDYEINDIVCVDGINSDIWMSVNATNLNQNPTTRTFTHWTNYFGAITATIYDATVIFYAGEIVYDGTLTYMSIQNDNTGNVLTDTDWWLPLDAPTYVGATNYGLGARVMDAGITYASIQAGNVGNTPSSSPLWWTAITGVTLSGTSFIYPIGAGPNSQASTRNVYRLPNNFMREAAQAPKQGSYMPMGAPAGLPYSDWQFESNYFTTQLTGLIALRFAADISDPNAMDPMFVDGLSCRIALAICETITQSGGKLEKISAMYNKFMSEARTVNGIETGAVEPPEDAYIALRS